jgi:nucleoside-diphosphate-sugar epimerase
VHDAARLFRLALEQAPPGSVLHAVDDEADPMRAIADVLGVPVKSAPAKSFGMRGMIFGIDQPSSSALTRERFGWNPTQPTLLEDLEKGDYPD